MGISSRLGGGKVGEVAGGEVPGQELGERRLDLGAARL
jgi:hypothetical protein